MHSMCTAWLAAHLSAAAHLSSSTLRHEYNPSAWWSVVSRKAVEGASKLLPRGNIHVQHAANESMAAFKISLTVPNLIDMAISYDGPLDKREIAHFALTVHELSASSDATSDYMPVQTQEDEADVQSYAEASKVVADTGVEMAVIVMVSQDQSGFFARHTHALQSKCEVPVLLCVDSNYDYESTYGAVILVLKQFDEIIVELPWHWLLDSAKILGFVRHDAQVMQADAPVYHMHAHNAGSLLTAAESGFTVVLVLAAGTGHDTEQLMGAFNATAKRDRAVSYTFIALGEPEASADSKLVKLMGVSADELPVLVVLQRLAAPTDDELSDAPSSVEGEGDDDDDSVRFWGRPRPPAAPDAEIRVFCAELPASTPTATPTPTPTPTPTLQMLPLRATIDEIAAGRLSPRTVPEPLRVSSFSRSLFGTYEYFGLDEDDYGDWEDEDDYGGLFGHEDGEFIASLFAESDSISIENEMAI